jgi:hypothetical protein
MRWGSWVGPSNLHHAELFPLVQPLPAPMMVAFILIIGTGITGLPIKVFLFAIDLSSQGSPFEACEPHL